MGAIGWITMQANLESTGCAISIQPSNTGVAAYGRPQIPWYFIDRGVLSISVSAPQRTYDLDGSGVIGIGDLALFATSWLQNVRRGKPRTIFDCDNRVGPGDLSWFATGGSRT